MLKHITDKEFNDLFDLLGEVFHAHDIDYYLIGAIARDYWYKKGISALVIGREMKKTCINNPALCNRIEKILSAEIKKGQTSSFLRNMQEETSSDIELMKMWLEKMLMGFTQF
jgi:hypothetical protein